MARNGLNCTLSYSDGKANRAYRVRCSDLAYGYEQIADEATARAQKAFYPHQTAPTQFSIVVDLIGMRERASFNFYLMQYANLVLDPGIKGTAIPKITVTLPSRNFTRVGVPLAGIEYGDHLASMVFKPRIVFETSGEPLDWKEKFYTSTVQASRAWLKSPESQYFYPTGTQLRGGESPVGLGGVTTPQEAISGLQAVFNDITDRLEQGFENVKDSILGDSAED